MAVAVDQHHGFKPFNRSQRCRLQSFTHLEYNLLEVSHRNLAHSIKQVFEVANFHRSVSTPCLSFATNVEEEFDTHPRIEIIGGRRAPRVAALVVEVAIAIASGVAPMPVSNGLGGAYFFHNQSGEIIAVAKPIDEEPLAFNNPKGFGGLTLGQPGIKRSIRVGETGIRELAAYLLDHGGFAGVPATGLVKISHVAFHVNEATAVTATPYKIASLQNFVSHDFDAGELGPSSFSVASVHRIGILDLRILNLDRHAGNIIVKKNEQHENYAIGAIELVPIDHGLCLPECLDDPYFEWLYWPQASIPFSELEIEYISNLDPNKDAELLRTELPSLRESSIRVLILCTIFLKQAASVGLCLADIGAMMSREFRGDEENSSILETLCAKAKASVFNTLEADDDDDMDNYDKIEVDDDVEDFEFVSNEVADLPKLLQSHSNLSKLTKSLKVSSVRSMPGLHGALLSPLYEEIDNDNSNCDTENVAKNGDDDNKISSSDGDSKAAGGLVKSMSFSVQNSNYESGGISFENMSEDEWEMFLECFEKLLPQVFEGFKFMSAKQRLGSSCKF
ncbi:phosphatidylinositol 4-kinase gamma 8 [Durio zibethinus]|uniref:1-phosphatidylinositol 4-kinase n=1 Tax=Durio zibethinus TaxID=66656 RepID=A0A6P5YUX1_DURZI|nr:phosphatidylinositol 4-kinase gamma 8 [Durio zibethinus]